jgi:hypothetical protein
MKALFPERTGCSTKDLKELWRMMKTKAKAVARDKKVDLENTGGGETLIAEICKSSAMRSNSQRNEVLEILYL